MWVADYVVADYGTGAVMAVPCGDQRDLSLPASTTCRSCRSSWTMTIALPSRPAARPSIPSMPRPSTGIAPTLPRARSSSPASTPACAAVSTPRARLHRGRPRGHGLRSSQGRVPPARLAHQPSALLGQPHPGHPLRALRYRARARGSAAGDAAREPGPGRRRDPRRVQGLLRDHLPGLRSPGQARN